MFVECVIALQSSPQPPRPLPRSVPQMSRQRQNPLYLTPEQSEWMVMQRVMMRSLEAHADLHRPPKGRGCRREVYDLVQRPAFDRVVAACICVDIALMATEHADQSETWTRVLTWTNRVFAALYTLEIALKLVGWGPANYFRNSFRVCDFTVVLVGAVMAILDAAQVCGVRREGALPVCAGPRAWALKTRRTAICVHS